MTKIDLGILVTLIVVLVTGILMMPAEECSGDAMAVRVETVHLLKEGKLGVPEEIATKYQGDKGMFFCKNEVTGKWFPKYGVINSLIYVPALRLEQLLEGKLEYPISPLRLLLLNIHNIVLSLMCAALFYLTVRLFTQSQTVACIYVLSIIYMTFCWYYFRAQIFEIHALLFLSGAFYSAFRGRRELLIQGISVMAGSVRAWILACALFLGVLILSKTLYVVLLPAFFAFFFLSLKEANNRVRLIGLAWFCIPVGLFCTILLALNHFKFGSIYNTGYSQWIAESKPLSGDIIKGMWGYLFDGQWGVLSCFPIIMFAFFYWRRFYNINRIEAVMILSTAAIILAINSCFINWRGTWCYGPRYLLPILSLVGMPAIYLLEDVSSIKKQWARIASVLGLLFFGISLIAIQSFVIRLPFYTWYQLDAIVAKQYSSKTARYMFETPYWLINRDIVAMQTGGNSALSELLISELPRDQKQRAEELIFTLKPNYYWFR